MRQAIGDRAGEAATFYQLGVLASRLEKGRHGALLVAICFLIERAMGHGKARFSLERLGGLCQALNDDQIQINALLEEAAREYQRDRGRDLIDRTLGESEPGGPTT